MKMAEIISCESCRQKFEKAEMRYSPKCGVSRYYCVKCYEKKTHFDSLQATKRNFRKSLPVKTAYQNPVFRKY